MGTVPNYRYHLTGLAYIELVLFFLFLHLHQSDHYTNRRQNKNNV